MRELIIREEIGKAIENKKPIVALESTVIAHGLPYPENLKIAKTLENIIRKEGAVPATIAVINGKVHIGLAEEELQYIAKAKDILKLSTRDIPVCMAKKKTGATTVSATIYLASLAGIKVFATGGLGGIHKEVTKTWDISRDVEELSVTDIIVVCSGAKSILDLPKTAEYLETKGIITIGYKTDSFPAFYTADSSIPIQRADSIEEIIKVYEKKRRLKLPGAVVVGNPVKKEYEIPEEEISRWVEDALQDAKERDIRGKRITPFLLGKLAEISKGKTVNTNLELLKENAKLAGKIAVALERCMTHIS